MKIIIIIIVGDHRMLLVCEKEKGSKVPPYYKSI